MKKLGIILDETTIINLPLFGSLIKRYRMMSAIIPLVCVIGSMFLYSAQSTVYRQKARFKNISNENNSPLNSIATVLGESSGGGINASEVIGIPQSTDFQVALAQALMEHEDFYKLNFSKKKLDEDFSMRAFLADCQLNVDCKVQRVRNLVNGTFFIKSDTTVLHSFYLTVTTLDYLTTNTLLEVISELITTDRLQTLKHQIVEQIKISQGLVDSKEDELEQFSIDQIKDRKAKIENQILIINGKLSNFNNEYNRLKLNLNFYESKYSQSRSISSKRVSDSDVKALENKKRLIQKRKDLKTDITTLSGSGGDSEKLILSQLKIQLAEVERKLKNLKTATYGKDEQIAFYNNNSKRVISSKFDYQVKKNQLIRMKQDKIKIQNERKELLTELSDINKKLDAAEPSFEYLKLLKQKLVQLKLLESTIISDLVFESEFNNMQIFKKSSKSKYVVFTLVLSFFGVLIIILIRYLSDDRIYNEIEMEKRFEGISIIGNTPEFE